jgi:hypothetical protein
MSLRKRPTLTPALLAVNRRNAQKSTGPRTEEGKRRVVLNGLRHGLRSRSFRQSLIKSGEGTAVLDRNFLFHVVLLWPQTRQEVHRIARFVQALWSVARWERRHEVRAAEPHRFVKNLMTQLRLDGVLAGVKERMPAADRRPGIVPAKPECGSKSITSSDASEPPSPSEADLLRRTGPILLPGLELLFRSRPRKGLVRKN